MWDSSPNNPQHYCNEDISHHSYSILAGASRVEFHLLSCFCRLYQPFTRTLAGIPSSQIRLILVNSEIWLIVIVTTYMLHIFGQRHKDESHVLLQFSVTEHVRTAEVGRLQSLPAVFFFYDLSPIKVGFSYMFNLWWNGRSTFRYSYSCFVLYVIGHIHRGARVIPPLLDKCMRYSWRYLTNSHPLELLYFIYLVPTSLHLYIESMVVGSTLPSLGKGYEITSVCFVIKSGIVFILLS